MEIHHAHPSTTTSAESTVPIVRAFRAIVDRVTPGAIESLFEHPGEPFRSFPLIWVVGPAASGKSTVASFLHATFPDIPVIHDRHALTEQLRKRHDGLRDSTLPTVIDESVLTASLDTVIREASQAPRALIELGRGGRESSQADPMSFEFALARIPAETLLRSLFVYLNVPFETRLSRNEERPEATSGDVGTIPEVRCSDDTMQRVFHDDDAERLMAHPNVSFIELKNTRSRSDLLDVVTFLFGRNV